MFPGRSRPKPPFSRLEDGFEDKVRPGNRLNYGVSLNCFLLMIAATESTAVESNMRPNP